MLTNSDYREWKRFHCVLLIIKAKEYDDYLAELEPMFRKMGATLAELDSASCWIAEDPARADLPWRTHYGLIRQHIFKCRREDANRKNTARRKKEESASGQTGQDWLNSENRARLLRIIGKSVED